MGLWCRGRCCAQQVVGSTVHYCSCSQSAYRHLPCSPLPQKRALIERIAEHSLMLSQDPFGNYVVQYVLELGHPETSAMVMTNLKGHYSELATQKFRWGGQQGGGCVGSVCHGCEQCACSCSSPPTLQAACAANVPRVLRGHHGWKRAQAAAAPFSSHLLTVLPLSPSSPSFISCPTNEVYPFLPLPLCPAAPTWWRSASSWAARG